MLDDFFTGMPAIKPRRGTHVRETPELRRIRDMPVRDWESNPALAVLVDGLTERLRTNQTIPKHMLTCNGGDVPDRLLPAQAIALMDLTQRGGALVPLVTGGGKTLLTLLAPKLVGARTSILNIPKRLIPKTLRAAHALWPYWHLPDVIIEDGTKTVLSLKNTCELHLISYQVLPHRATCLLDLAPDLYMADECHYLKNRRAAATKIVKQLRRRLPNTAFMCLSGSMAARDLRDFTHMARWCLGMSAPVPTDWVETQSWALATAEKVNDESRLEPGALLQLGDAMGDTPLDTARRRFAQRLTRTPGIISAANDLPPCGLIVREIDLPPTPEMDRWLNELRAKNELPNGDPCEDALSLYAKERQCAMEFWYQYKTPPPIPWRNAKKAWASWCFAELRLSKTMFSAMDVANRIDRGELDDGGVLAKWREIRSTFEPETEAVWFGDSTLKWAQAWLEKEQGLCWVSHVEFGDRLSEITGVPYFREQARCGRLYIEDHSGPAIVSVFSCNEGLNLQHKWHSNVIMSCPTGKMVEQLLSRTHRRNQLEDDVTCDIVIRVEADKKAWLQAKADAKCVTDTMAQRQRLAIATYE